MQLIRAEDIRERLAAEEASINELMEKLYQPGADKDAVLFELSRAHFAIARCKVMLLVLDNSGQQVVMNGAHLHDKYVDSLGLDAQPQVECKHNSLHFYEVVTPGEKKPLATLEIGGRWRSQGLIARTVVADLLATNVRGVKLVEEVANEIMIRKREK